MGHDVAGWRTPSISESGNCVGLREEPDGSIAVCNTNDPHARSVVFARPAVAAWIAACKVGQLDDLG